MPLEEGERPRAVTVGALLALCLALGTIVAYTAGVEVNGRTPHLQAAAQSFLMVVTAIGMWRSRYWAVLGMQAILVILILIFSLLALTAQNALGVLLALGVVASAGTLFWFLVRAMARIQMPARR